MNRMLLAGILCSGALMLSESSAPPLPDQWSMASPAICRSGQLGNRLLKELLIASAVAAPASQGQPIRLYNDLTGSTLKAGTSNIQAQAYFSQGMVLSYSFNHAGAVRSFREAQNRDPDCALCWWGEALALGPNINAPMDERDRPAALKALRQA